MRVRFSYTLLLLLCTVVAEQDAQAQGLRFRGAPHPIDQRTSYDVFDGAAPRYDGSFDIEFDMQIYPEPEAEVGYVLRIKEESGGSIYNLWYDVRGIDAFKFNEEGKWNLITTRIDPEELLGRQWFRVRIEFDLAQDSVRLTVHDRTLAVGQAGLPDTYRPVIVFGKSDHVIDVPAFAIKNLTVGGSRKQRFPLNQSRGGEIFNDKGRPTGKASHPEWLINDAYSWKHRATFASHQQAGASYSAESNLLYYFNRDSLTVFDLTGDKAAVTLFGHPAPIDIDLGMNFIDPAEHKLYAYEVYKEGPDTAASVAALDLRSLTWETRSRQRLPSQLHHHAGRFDPVRRTYTIYGGFGQMRFSSDFYRYTLADDTWERIELPESTSAFPRYFVSMGCRPEEEALYLFGGMGNESGDQTVGRTYYYDLHRYDPAAKRIEKLWEIPWQGPNVVPVRNMILHDGRIYTLCYPESVSDSYLRLYRFSLDDGSYEILGDSIPIRSDKIATNANLYFNEQRNELVATVQEFDDDISSRLHLYTLAFPAISAAELAELDRMQARPCGRWLTAGIAGLLLAAAGGLLFYRKRIARRSPEAERSAAEAETAPAAGHRPNSVYLFGDFHVRDRRNRDITYMFSAQQKQIFCLILQYSVDEGISSKLLSCLVWPEKSELQVKNSRNVAINHLRKTLREIDGVELIHESGRFRIVQQAPFYCDHTRSFEIAAAKELTPALRDELVGIVSRGKFLQFFDLSLFDAFKKELELRLEPLLLREIAQSFGRSEHGATLAFAGAIFRIDPLNNEAFTLKIKTLLLLKRTEEAVVCYKNFTTEYKHALGIDYPVPFREM